MSLELTGERVRARPWSADDIAHVWTLVQEQETMFGPPGLISSEEDARRWVDEQLAIQADPERTRFRFAVELTSSSAFIGGCRLHIEDGSNKMASIGMTLHKPSWGRGLGSELAQLLLRLAFEKLELHRVEALIEPTNARSLGLVRAMGFTHEGRLRERIFDARWIDTEVYSLLEHEWRAR
jgi:ribosomal-protein-alanine N-acetyltransferase